MNKHFVLTIDQGNSKTSAMLFQSGEAIDRANTIDDVLELVARYQLTGQTCKTLVSNVTKNQLDLIGLHPIEISVWFTINKFRSMPVHYEASLGQDRLACAYYAFQAYPNSWVIDSGTFTTVDYVSDEKFEGGFILPGLKLISDSYGRGANLFAPQTAGIQISKSLPHSSEQAINQGTVLTFIEPILKAISLRAYQSLIVTGGAGQQLYNCLKQELPAASIHLLPDLLHLSLFNMATKEYK